MGWEVLSIFSVDSVYPMWYPCASHVQKVKNNNFLGGLIHLSVDSVYPMCYPCEKSEKIIIFWVVLSIFSVDSVWPDTMSFFGGFFTFYFYFYWDLYVHNFALHFHVIAPSRVSISARELSVPFFHSTVKSNLRKNSCHLSSLPWPSCLEIFRSLKVSKFLLSVRMWNSSLRIWGISHAASFVCKSCEAETLNPKPCKPV